MPSAQPTSGPGSPLAELISQIDALLGRHAIPTPDTTIALGIPAIDAALPGGLSRAGLHEWIGTCAIHPDTNRKAPWSPPFSLLIWVAGQCGQAHGIVWVGERVWPYAPSLTHAPPERRIQLDRCLFVRPHAASDRLWAADMALRSRSAGAVIVDASSFDLAATRRLQLAAEAGMTPCLLARPPYEQLTPSAATTRWLVSRATSPTTAGRWSVRLLRCKGMHTNTPSNAEWVLERDHATGTLRMAADILNGSRSPEQLPRRVRHTG